MCDCIHIKITPLSGENFKDLLDSRLFPYSCKCCAFWESLEFDDFTPKETAERIKQEWIHRVRKEFGNWGFILHADNNRVGFAQFAPPKFFPTISKHKAGKPSEDAVFLACLYIARRELRRKGIGRHFLKRSNQT